MNLEVHKATVSDANALFILNEKFNGAGCTTLERIKKMLIKNNSETVFIAKQKEKAVGFCCTQLFESMCYSVNYVEITELFVDEAYRRNRIASSLMNFVENFFGKDNAKAFQLFTGGSNFNAQSFYEKQGYCKTTEIMYRKR